MQFLFHRQFGNPIGIFRNWNHVLGHRTLTGAVDCDRGSKHEALHVVIDRRIDEIHGADQVVVLGSPVS